MKDDEQDLVVKVEPLNDWSNPPDLTDLKQNYTDALPIHQTQITKIKGYLDNLNITGDAVVRVPKGNSTIVPRLIRKQAEWRYPALSEPFLSNNNIFKVKPVSWEDREAAHQNEMVLNHQFNVRMNKVKFIDEYVRTAVDEGTVIVQTGWEFEEEEEEVDVPIIQLIPDPEYEATHMELAQLREQSPSEYDTDVPEELKEAHEATMADGVPYRPVIEGYKKEVRPRTIKNHPTAKILNSRNVVIDPTCEGDISNARFVVHFRETSLAELKASGLYKNLDAINLEAHSVLGQPDHSPTGESRNFNFRDRMRKKFNLYEYWGFWDIHGKGKLVPIVVAWAGDVMVRAEVNPYPDGKLPFVVVQYLPVRKETHGEPDGALLEDNQKVAGAVTRGMLDLLGKSANGQTGIRRDMLDATNRRKFLAGQDYEFNANVDPRQGVHMHTYPEIPSSAQMMLQLQNVEAESLTGVKTFANTGINGAALGDVATSVRGALDAASKREMGILRRLAEGICEIGRKFLAMNQVFLSEEEVVRITNEQFVTVRRDNLLGSFDLELGISTPEEDNNKAEQLAFILQTLGPDEDPMIRRMVLADICRLRKMPDLAKRIESFEPQPDPFLEKRKELELAAMEAEINKNLALAEYYARASNLNEAKVGTEYTRQNLFKSEADKLNLDFVEQEAGVKQERDLEKQGAQARAQTEMKRQTHMMDLERDAAKQQGELLREYIRARSKTGSIQH